MKETRDSMEPCRLCGRTRQIAFRHQILGKKEIAYYVCPECGLLQTEKATWLAEAYSEAVSRLDTGVLVRNASLSRRLAVLLATLLNPAGTYVDVGGGYGLLVRWLRDYGFNFFWTDKYAENLFARGFEAPAEWTQVDGLVACEVLEHVEDPRTFVADYFARYHTKTLVFTTLTYAGAPPSADWWYYAFPSGQHVSFYTRDTLRILAQSLGTTYYPIDDTLHVFTDRPVRPVQLKLLSSKVWVRLYFAWLRLTKPLPSKTESDRDWISRQPR